MKLCLKYINFTDVFEVKNIFAVENIHGLEENSWGCFRGAQHPDQ